MRPVTVFVKLYNYVWQAPTQIVALELSLKNFPLRRKRDEVKLVACAEFIYLLIIIVSIKVISEIIQRNLSKVSGLSNISVPTFLPSDFRQQMVYLQTFSSSEWQMVFMKMIFMTEILEVCQCLPRGDRH